MDVKAEYTVTAVITRGGDGQPAEVLAEPSGAAWRLPALAVPPDTDSRALAPALRAAIAARYGLSVAELSLLATDRDGAQGDRTALVALDAFSVPKDGTEPAGVVWLAAGQLAPLTFASEAVAALVRGWLAGLSPTGGHALRLPWTRPGWLAEATGWITEQLTQAGLTLAGPIEQHRTWSLSVLLRAPLAVASAYFKALPPLFAAEPRLTQALAQRFPTLIPAVIALDEPRHWLLLRAFEGELLQDRTDLAVWINAVQAYARLQAATAGEPEFVLGLGGPDRRLPVLPAQFGAVLAEHKSLAPGDLTPDEHAALHTLLPRLPAACAALEACGVPYALEHGDLHGNNIAVTASGPVIFDWSDGCLAHPFTCLTTLLEQAPPGWHQPLSAAYAKEWSAFATPEQLDRALTLARPLGAAHLAVSYANILRTTEPGQRWQLAGALPFFLREVLKYKDALNTSS